MLHLYVSGYELHPTEREKFFIDTASGDRLRVDSMRGAAKAEDAHKHFPESYITKYTSDVHVFVPGYEPTY